jgi:ubiquinol-cytochrome c reductase core subunit 2
VTLHSLDTENQTSSLAIYMKAGSKYDSNTLPGTAHLFSSSLLRTLPSDTITRTVLETELRGNSLYSSLNREFVAFGQEFLRDDL